MGLIIDSYLQRKKSLHLVNVHRVISMSKESVYHGRQDDVQSVNSVYEVTERDIKRKPVWKVLVGVCVPCPCSWNAPTWYSVRAGKTRITRSTMRCAYREYYPSKTTPCVVMEIIVAYCTTKRIEIFPTLCGCM